MALNIPTDGEEVAARARVDVSRSLLTSNPFLKNSWLSGLITGFSNRVMDLYFALTQAQKEAIPDTADLNLAEWASIWAVVQIPATVSEGAIAFIGTASSIIPISTPLISSDGKIYLTQGAATITLQSLSVSSITRVGTVATVTTASDHLLASNVPVTITGAVETDYNVTASAITVTSATTFTFTVAGSPTTPATGTILAGFTSVSATVQSQDFGVLQNQVVDTPLTLQSPIVGVTDEANVDYGALTGGVDAETNTALRERMLDKIQNPVAHFNEADIIAIAKTVPGVTRVFVQPITPAVGQVTTYFMRDNDPVSIPDAAEILAVKTAILTINPANTDPDDVIVSAPVAVPTAFTFTDIQPATASMFSAVEDSLNQFYDERVDVEVNVDEDAYRAAIFNTVDSSNGDKVTTFVLSVPSGDITITTGEIGTLGTVTTP